MQTIINIIVFFLILGAIVLIHELGHFLTAKLFGVYCAEFSIGMGPKLFSKKKGETVIFTNYYWTKPIEEDMLVILSTDEKPQKLNSITVPSTTSNSTPIDYARTADYSSRN